MSSTEPRMETIYTDNRSHINWSVAFLVCNSCVSRSFHSSAWQSSSIYFADVSLFDTSLNQNNSKYHNKKIIFFYSENIQFSIVFLQKCNINVRHAFLRKMHVDYVFKMKTQCLDCILIRAEQKIQKNLNQNRNR